MRKIKEGETAEIKLGIMTGLGLLRPHFFIGGEEVTVPHNTVFRATQGGEEIFFTYVELWHPLNLTVFYLMFKGTGEYLTNICAGDESRLDNNRMTAVRVPE